MADRAATTDERKAEQRRYEIKAFRHIAADLTRQARAFRRAAAKLERSVDGGENQ